MSQSAIEIFLSYVHEDEALRDKLAKHLQVLQREGIIKVWHDRKITPGEDWRNKIDSHLQSADIILPLISSDFLNSDYHYDIELKLALERHENKESRVIPVILRAVDWQDAPFGKLSALPKNGKAIAIWDNEDEAFTDVVKGLRRFIDCFPADPDSRIGANPYKGLSAFEKTDGDQFFGRDPQIKELWEKFRSLHETESSTRLLTIYGPSGSGKSSLVMAGLIPELERQPLHGCDPKVVMLSPNSHPLTSLAKSLAQITPNESTYEFQKKCEFYTGKLTEANAEGVFDGLQWIADTLEEINIPPLIVMIDQLEEVFTLCKDPKERDAFIGNLLCAAADRSKRVSAIFTLRSDFLGSTQKHPLLNQLIAAQGYSVAAMNEDGLREAISKPAELAGHPLDLSTVNLLIKQTADREGALPLLQFALTQIWVGLEEGTEPAEKLTAIGNVGGALAGKAQWIYERLNSDEKKIAQRVFLGLVQLGEGTKDTRRRIKLERIVAHRDSLEQVQKVIDRFASPGQRLITLADDNGTRTIEVTHEALFDNWPQLKNWLNDSRNDLRFQRRLDDAVMVWQENGRPEGNLWRSPDLDLLKSFDKNSNIDMTSMQKKFLKSSIQSAKWKKIKEISSYCIFSSLVPLCFFSIKYFIDTEYIMAKIQNKNTFFVPEPAVEGDKRRDYYYDLLYLVLSEAYPGKKIEIKTRKAENVQAKKSDKKTEPKTKEVEDHQIEKTFALNKSEIDFNNLENRTKIDIDWMMTTFDRNNAAKSIDFPLTRGLLSHRLCLVNEKNLDFNEINNAKDKDSFIKKIRVTQVGDWPDVNFLEINQNVNLNRTKSYDKSIEQLLDGSANCFLRGLSEIYLEQEQLNKKYQQKFLVLNKFFFQYYSPVNFYVKKENSELADAIYKELKKSVKSGKLLCIYKHHYGDFIKEANLKKSNKIQILRSKDQKAPQYYLDFAKDYKKIFENIEKEQTSEFKGEECNKLINHLEENRPR
jgi:TIR domain